MDPVEARGALTVAMDTATPRSLLCFASGTFAEEVRMLNVGDQAPDFTVTAHDGQPVTLSALRGSKVLLWFYPKADTPG
jgi:peroxiredoxin